MNPLLSEPNPSVWRLPADEQGLERLMQDEVVQRALESGKALRARTAMRMRLLGGAVMVDPAVLPHLAQAVEGLTSRYPDIGDVECFVFHASSVNAFVTKGRTRTLMAVSSGAVNHLEAAELEFVLGHEVGHALFGHADVVIGNLADDGSLLPASAMRIRAWQRAAEISADRAGLLLCGSIDAAAHAVFKAASGIVAPGMVVSPERFAAQWHRLVDEVIDEGERGFWQITHPFPPLRMQAMLAFWEAFKTDAPWEAVAEANRAIDSMLAMMDPSDADGALRDRVLSGFFFWGGLYIALADFTVQPEEERRLRSVMPSDVDFDDALRQGNARPAVCLEQFKAVNHTRRRKLTPVELHRIVYGLIDVASADGKITHGEMDRLRELAAVLGVPAEACDIIVGQYEEEARNGA